MVTVNSGAELNTELTNATGGEIIEIAAGVNVGSITVNAKNYASEVVVRSLDTNNKGVFTYLRVFNGCNNLTFRDVIFNYTFTSGDSSLLVNFSSENSNNIKFDQISISGDQDGSGYNTGTGLYLSYGLNNSVTNCDIHNFNNLLESFNNTNITITGNQFRGQASDALKITSCVTALIRGNHFHSVSTVPFPGAHMDFIQLQRNLGGCTDVDALNNVFDYGNGHWGQCFWAGGDGYDLSVQANRHQRVTIRDNIFYNGHTNGYGVWGTDDLTLENNSMFEGTPASMTPTQTQDANGNYSHLGVSQAPYPRYNIDSGCTNVIIRNCIAAGTVGTFDPSWTTSNNHIITRSSYGGDITVHAKGSTDSYHDYELASGAAHTGMAGSRMMKRTGGWAGQEIAPPSTYQGGVSGVTPLPVLPAGSVAATVTVP